MSELKAYDTEIIFPGRLHGYFVSSTAVKQKSTALRLCFNVKTFDCELSHAQNFQCHGRRTSYRPIIML